MKILIILLFICSLVVATSTCPPGGGIVCYPDDCSNQFQKCNGDVFNDPENTPAGFKCSQGHFVFSSFCLSPRPACPVEPSCSLSQVLSESDYLSFFPQLNGGAINKVANQRAIFNYSYLISAAKRFPAFACTGKEEDRKREVAAFLGQTSQETSGWWGGQPYSWGYYFSTEIGCTNDNCKQYCRPESTEYPCVPGKSYFGRGPIQLSWNYNYGQFSQAIYGDKNVLLNNPDLIFEGDNAFLTALWFWMTPQKPKPSCHDVIVGAWEPSADDIAKGRLSGFGMTTNIINGALECSKETPQSVTNRVSYFSTYAEKFGVAIGPNLFCNNMTHY